MKKQDFARQPGTTEERGIIKRATKELDIDHALRAKPDSMSNLFFGFTARLMTSSLGGSFSSLSFLPLVVERSLRSLSLRSTKHQWKKRKKDEEKDDERQSIFWSSLSTEQESLVEGDDYQKIGAHPISFTRWKRSRFSCISSLPTCARL